jgi:hypothetical protein
MCDCCGANDGFYVFVQFCTHEHTFNSYPHIYTCKLTFLSHLTTVQFIKIEHFVTLAVELSSFRKKYAQVIIQVKYLMFINCFLIYIFKYYRGNLYDSLGPYAVLIQPWAKIIIVYHLSTSLEHYH